MPQVIAFAAPLAHAGKHRVARVELCDIVDELLDDDRLADPRTAEDGGLAALGEGCNQVDDFHAGLKDLGLSRLVHKGGSGPVDRIIVGRFYRCIGIDGVAEHVKNPAQASRPDRDLDGRAGPDDVHAAAQAVSARHGHCAHPAFSRLALHLADQATAPVQRNFQRVEHVRQIRRIKGGVDHRTDDLRDFSLCTAFCHVLTPIR